MGPKKIHDAGIIHYDIKPANIFFNESSYEVKIIDFGTSQNIGSVPLLKGTPFYTAPEIMVKVNLLNKAKSYEGYLLENWFKNYYNELERGLIVDKTADIYSMGKIFCIYWHESSYQKEYHMDKEELFHYRQNEYKNKCLTVAPFFEYRNNKPMLELITEMVHPNSQQRPSLENAMLRILSMTCDDLLLKINHLKEKKLKYISNKVVTIIKQKSLLFTSKLPLYMKALTEVEFFIYNPLEENRKKLLDIADNIEFYRPTNSKYLFYQMTNKKTVEADVNVYEKFLK